MKTKYDMITTKKKEEENGDVNKRIRQTAVPLLLRYQKKMMMQTEEA